MLKFLGTVVAGLVLASVAPAQYTETLDGGFPSNWTQSTTDLRDWSWNQGPTPSSGTGPTGDHTTGSGGYVYLEATGALPGDDAVVTGPVIAASAGAPTMTFWYHMNGSGMGMLEVHDYDGTNWNMVWSIIGPQGAAWLQATVPLTVYGPNNRSEFRFRAIRGSSFQSDICIDDVSVTAPILPLYQVNTPAATMDINGAVGDDQTIGSTSIFNSCPSICVNIGSTLTGNGWDLAYAVGEAPTSLGNSFITGEGQIVNLDISGLGVTGPTFLNGGNLPDLVGTSIVNTSLCVGFPQAAGTVMHAQMVVSDPTRPDGLSLSAPARAEWLADPLPATPALTDDSFAEVDLGCFGSVVFGGTAYDSIFVNSNGTVGLGQGDSAFTASPAGGASGAARVGFWSDLSPQLAGASVTVDEAGGILSVDFVNVPYFSPNTVTVSYSISFDTSNGNVSITGMGGINGNTTGAGFGDAQWLGLSTGGQADPGPTVFGAGFAGGPGTVLYEYVPGTVAPVLPPSVAAGMTSLTFTPDGSGGYFWVGL